MPRKHDPEREQVEWVFGLTGGELNDEAWGGFAYNYDEVPDYVRRDYPDLYDGNVSYRTVVGYFVYGSPPEELIDDEGIWERRATYASSGETECPLSPDRVEDARCPLCDSEPGDPHAYIYVGDGWAEVVYRLERPSDEE